VSKTEISPLVPSEGRRALLSISLSLLLPLIVAAILVPFRPNLANSAAALVLAGVVVAVAAFGDRRAGFIASVSSAVWFDFFLTRPYERLVIASAHDVETTLALLVVGVAVTEIAVRSRRLYAMAWQEGNYLALIHDLSELVATGVSPEEVIALARDDLIELLRLRRCSFEPMAPTTQRPRLQRNGEVELGEARFDVERDGLPTVEIELVAQSHGRDYGLFVMEAGDLRAVSIEQRVVALALADQVGSALAASSQAA
jgi:K+-sensing histidine kinase KdpD